MSCMSCPNDDCMWMGNATTCPLCGCKTIWDEYECECEQGGDFEDSEEAGVDDETTFRDHDEYNTDSEDCGENGDYLD